MDTNKEFHVVVMGFSKVARTLGEDYCQEGEVINWPNVSEMARSFDKEYIAVCLVRKSDRRVFFESSHEKGMFTGHLCAYFPGWEA